MSYMSVEFCLADNFGIPLFVHALMTQASWSISPRIGEFTREIIPLEEIQTFYRLDQVTIPEDRPYAWSNTVATLDGVIGYIILKFI